MTPSFIGLIATMLPGVLPSMSFASLPTASIRPLTLLIATMEGSFTTMPLPRAYTQVFAVPRSIARSLENRENRERRLKIDYLYENGRENCCLSKLPKGQTSLPGLPGASVARGVLAGQHTLVRSGALVRGACDVHAVLPVLLHPVHRFVRGMYELLGRRGDVGKRRH